MKNLVLKMLTMKMFLIHLFFLFCFPFNNFLKYDFIKKLLKIIIGFKKVLFTQILMDKIPNNEMGQIRMALFIIMQDGQSFASLCMHLLASCELALFPFQLSTSTEAIKG